MPRVLIITYYFPPWGMGGVQRVLKFAKYLPEHGWEVTVIAPLAAGYHNQDPTLLGDLPESVNVERVGYADKAMSLASNAIGRIGPIISALRYISSFRDLPDRHRSFTAQAVRRARELMKEKPHDLLLTSSPPPSVHLAGLSLCRNLPWIADFRDPWQARLDDYGPTLYHRLRNSALHNRILRTADAVVAVTPELRRYFESFSSSGSVTVIRNGYDEADFVRLPVTAGAGADFRIVIPGTFSRFSQPRPLFRAIARFREGNPRIALRVTHVGAALGIDPAKAAADHGLSDVYHDTGYLDHSQALAALMDSDLLMIAYKDRASDVRVPGRIYEMLRTQRPIVAVTPSPGALADLLAPIPGCEVCSPDDPDAAAAAMARFMSAGSAAKVRTVEQIRSFDRREQTRQLSELAQKVIARRRGGPR